MHGVAVNLADVEVIVHLFGVGGWKVVGSTPDSGCRGSLEVRLLKEE